MSECKSCQSPIFWVTTEQGKHMPIDVDPVAGGNIRLEKRGRGMVAIVDKDTTDGRLRYVSHYVTCPQASTWRKKKNA